MPRNDHKKVILQLSEAYKNVYTEEHDEYHPGYGKVEEPKHSRSELVKAVNEAQLGLEKMHANIKHEDSDIEALADAHDQLSRALHWLLSEEDVEYIMGGRADARAEADSRPEQFTSMEFPSDES
tara:strand:+ start:417 stop:791 length:375 start_codon:yes stop_codon:yes gene_type:complete